MPSDLAVLVGGADRSSRPAQSRGIVTRAPESIVDSLRVGLVNYSTDWTFTVPGPNWMTRGGTLPAEGDQCLVVFDDDGDAWIPAWTGVTSGVSTGSTDAHYDHLQSIPASLWTIAHGLGKVPSVTVVDSGGSVVQTGVHIVDLNTIQVTFAGNATGHAYLN